MREVYDVVVVGGGFFGAAIAIEARRHQQRVLLLERERELMRRASYSNQARIHQGYHYPRSLLTAERSRINFPLFEQAYAACVVSDFQKLYAVARHHSKVSAAQFQRFCQRIGAPISKAPKELSALFDRSTVEDVFTVREHAFDALKLRGLVEQMLAASGVDVCVGAEVTTLQPGGERLVFQVALPDGESRSLQTRWLFNCTYANLNGLLQQAGLETIPLKHELVEIALVQPPAPFDQLGLTMMDGAFFSCMPFPAARAHSLTHVRYTPHRTWFDAEGGAPQPTRLGQLQELAQPSLFEHMVRDVARFVPLLRRVQYQRSLWEVKTLLPQSERDDSRPILFRQSVREPRIVSVLGAKIDNVIDMREHVAQLLR